MVLEDMDQLQEVDVVVEVVRTVVASYCLLSQEQNWPVHCDQILECID